MKPRRIAGLFALAVALAACDGGARGSGITTAQGNVSSVDTALRDGAPARTSVAARLRAALALETVAHAQTDLAGIHVSVEGTTIADDTDERGTFALRGKFEGFVAIHFQRTSGGPVATITLNAPAGGTLTLNDVQLDERNGDATAREVDVQFEGLVADTDCASAVLRLVSRHRGPTDTDVYTVRLDTSSLHDRNGMPVSCADLRQGDPVTLHGTVNPDETFGHADVTVG